MDAVFAFVTSVPQHTADPFAHSISEEALAEGRIVKPSWVRADKLFTLEQELVIKKVARLSVPQLDQIRQRLNALLVDSIPPTA